MEIVLMCESESGEAGFAPESIEGFNAPRRSYDIVNGILTLAGYPEPILHHDAEELLQQSIYRLPTPLEQEIAAKAAAQQAEAQESEQTPDDPPAVQSKKKNGGG